MGSVGRIDDLVSEAGLAQLDLLYEKLGVNTQAMANAIGVANKLNTELGGTTGLNDFSTASNKVVAAMENVANTGKLVIKGQNDIADATERAVQKTIQAAQKKAEAEERALNKYLVNLSKQETARQIAYNKEIQEAERQAAKLQAIFDKAQAEAERKAAVQFPKGGRPISPVEREPDKPMVAGVANQSDYEGGIRRVTEATQAETAAMAQQAEVMAGLSTEYRANIELLLALQAERAENAVTLKGLTAQDAASGERLVFLTAEQLRLKIAIQQTNLALSQQTKQMLAEDTSGVQMQSMLDELRVKIGNLSAAELENVAIGGIMIAEAQRLDLAIKQLRDSTGDATKHVGDYARAQGTATVATELAERVGAKLVTQLIRMAAQFLLITVAFGAITWLYDWIKNLDIFTGRLDQATQNLKALNEVQQNAASNAGEIVGKYKILSDTVKDLSISYEDRLRAATELKKLFPEELEHSTAQAIANGKEADTLDRLKDSVVALAKAKAASVEIEKKEGEIIALQMQRDKVNSAKSSEQLRYAQEAQNEKSRFGANNRSSTPGKTVGEQADAILRENLRQSKNAADQANKDIQAQIAVKEQTIKYLEQYGGLQKEAEAIESKPTKPKKDNSAKQLNNDELELQREKLKGEKDAAKFILDNDDKLYSERLAALKVYIEKSNSLIGTENEIANRAPGITPTKKKVNNQIASNQRVEVDIFAQQQQDKLLLDAKKDYKKTIDEFEELITDDIKENLNQRLIAIEANNAKEADLLLDKYTKGKLSEQQYNRDLKIINDQANEAKIKAELDTEQAILGIQEGLNVAGVGNYTPKQIQATKDKVSALTNQYQRAQTQTKSDTAKGGKTDDKTLSQDQKEAISIIQSTQQLQQSGEEILNNIYQSQIQNLEVKKQLIQDTAQTEIDGVNNSILSNKEKAREIAIINAQAKVQQQQIQDQENKIKREQAVANKALAVASIIENTAVAAIKAPAELGPILGLAAVPVVLALGAAQLAAALSAPLPKFFKGTKNAPEGFAHVGERGTELQINPDGNMMLTPGTDTIKYLQKGTQIIPHHELIQMMAKPEPVMYVGGTFVDNKMLEKLMRENNELTKKQKAPIVRIYGDKWGAYSQQRNY